MIEKYENNYEAYFNDQMTTFESFEGELYKDKIEETIKHVFSKEDRSKSVLDFCCGDGTAINMLIDMGFKWPIGVDGNERKIARVRGVNAVLTVDDVCSDSLKLSKADIIYASHCFEHFLDPVKVLNNIRKFLTKDGKIIMILPYPNEESEGHPGSNKLMLNKSIFDITKLFKDNHFNVDKIEKINIREPELLITLKDAIT